MRREWIEIEHSKVSVRSGESPSMRREWIEIALGLSELIVGNGLPPCGGSGLKYTKDLIFLSTDQVSLHAEGVD